MPEIVTLGETMAMFSPSGGGPLRYITDYRLRIAGAESNVAIGAAKLGHTAGWISRLGEDEFGQYVRNMVRSEGVDTSGVTFDPDYPTGLMFKQLGEGEESQVFYYRRDSAATRLCAGNISDSLMVGARIFHLTGITPVLSKSCREAAMYAAKLAKSHGALLSFDPNIRRKLWGKADYTGLLMEWVHSADILLFGLDEACALLGCNEPEKIFSALFKMGVRYAVLKDGARGAWVGTPEKICRIPPVKCLCVDPIGAGDAFDSAFLCGVLEGRDVETCGRMGAIAGALVTQTVGDIEGYPSADRMQEMLSGTNRVCR